jgi:guanylate kinase
MSTSPPPESIPRKGIVLIVCGPAGSGKTTLCDRLLGEFSDLRRIITATTRQPRKGEVHGNDYYFFSESEFLEKIDASAFYEHALVHERHYGTLKSEVHRNLDSGHDIVLNIDVQGAASFRKIAEAEALLASRLVTIFIQPESIEVLLERLRHRASDSDEEIEKRLKTARTELKTAMDYHYVLPTSSKDHDYRIISSIYLAEKHRVVK